MAKSAANWPMGPPSSAVAARETKGPRDRVPTRNGLYRIVESCSGTAPEDAPVAPRVYKGDVSGDWEVRPLVGPPTGELRGPRCTVPTSRTGWP